jgi:hypothetical protein
VLDAALDAAGVVGLGHDRRRGDRQTDDQGDCRRDRARARTARREPAISELLHALQHSHRAHPAKD